MNLKAKAKILAAVFAVILVIFLMPKKCHPLAKSEVVKIAQTWMDRNKNIGAESIINSIEFDGKWWIVEIADRGCLVLLTIGDCGDVDVGGVSAGCNQSTELKPSYPL